MWKYVFCSPDLTNPTLAFGPNAAFLCASTPCFMHHTARFREACQVWSDYSVLAASFLGEMRGITVIPTKCCCEKVGVCPSMNKKPRQSVMLRSDTLQEDPSRSAAEAGRIIFYSCSKLSSFCALAKDSCRTHGRLLPLSHRREGKGSVHKHTSAACPTQPLHAAASAVDTLFTTCTALVAWRPRQT